MREKLNSNPIAQIALVGVLLLGGGFLALSSMGGGESEGGQSSKTATSSASATTPTGSASVAVTTAISPSGGAPSTPSSVAGLSQAPAPPLPRRLSAAFAANLTVVLLIVKKGGIVDRVTKIEASLARRLRSGVSMFIVPAARVSRYAAVTQGVKLESVPALIVVRPKRLDHGTPTASVSYGVQTKQSIIQAVTDARYRGHTLAYHP
ncbi:MAG TPA: hypothetical protein VND98_02610 [Solirubrobacterales bacterium]|nr:hypothetical protein [Solirubrobacterales bacterium]